jgi:glycerophosphoryl diester phosphodiesterase
MRDEPFYLTRPLNIAHRGARDVAPENTLAAFQAALDAGADGIELDVTRCATGEIVVIHDDTVDRTTDGAGLIKALPYDAVRELDAGSWFDARFEGERIPLLPEVLDAVGGRLRINIEIKGRAWRGDGLEAEIAAMVRARALAEHVVISSFNPWALARMKRAAPELACGLLYASPASHLDLGPLVANGWLRAEALHPQLRLVTPFYMARAQRRGLRVNVWTVNQKAEMQHLIALGVDGIITDHPALLRHLLGH